MIRMLRGTIEEVADSFVVLDVRGVGYLVRSPNPLSHFSQGEDTIFHTYLAVRETALDLYGFTTKNELEMFELLLGIPKIGPKSALGVLTQASPTLLIEAAQKKDGTYLHKLSGIGKKTSENIVQYLHDKIEHMPENSDDSTVGGLSQIQADAIDALITLGYDSSTARTSILHLPTDSATVNSLVTKALQQIS